MIEKYQLEPVVVFVEGVEIQLLLQLVYAVGPYLDLYGQKAAFSAGLSGIPWCFCV